MTTSRQKLVEFGKRLNRHLAVIEANEQDPRYLNPTFLEFKEYKNLLECLYVADTR